MRHWKKHAAAEPRYEIPPEDRDLWNAGHVIVETQNCPESKSEPFTIVRATHRGAFMPSLLCWECKRPYLVAGYGARRPSRNNTCDGCRYKREAEREAWSSASRDETGRCDRVTVGAFSASEVAAWRDRSHAAAVDALPDPVAECKVRFPDWAVSTEESEVWNALPGMWLKGRWTDNGTTRELCVRLTFGPDPALALENGKAWLAKRALIEAGPLANPADAWQGDAAAPMLEDGR